MYQQLNRSTKAIFYFPKSTLLLLSSPRLLSLCVIPLGIGIISAAIALIVFFIYREPLTMIIGFSEESWYFPFLKWIVFFFGSILSALFGFVTASIAGGFFIEQLIEKLFRRKGIELEQSGSTLTLIRSTFRSSLNEIILLIALLLCSFAALVLSLIPFLALLPIIIAAMIAGANLYFVSLGVLQVGIKKRLTIVKSHWLTCLLIGFCFTTLLVIPFAAIILMPVFYATVVEILAADETVRQRLNGYI